MADTEQETIQLAINTLAKTERGRRTLRSLHNWLRDAGGSGLDEIGQEAALALVRSAWGPYRGTTLDLLGDAANV